MNQNIWNVLNTTAYHFGRYWPKCVTWMAATPFPRIFRWFCLISAEHRKLIQSCKHKKLLKSVQPKRARAWKVTLIKSWASSQSALWVFVFELLRISQGTKLGHFSGCGCGSVVERSLPIPDVRGSISVIIKIYIVRLLSTVLTRKKRPGMAHFRTKNGRFLASFSVVLIMLTLYW